MATPKLSLVKTDVHDLGKKPLPEIHFQILKGEIRGLWREGRKNRYELGKKCKQLQDARAHAKTGTYMRDLAEMRIPYHTAQRAIKFYVRAKKAWKAKLLQNAKDKKWLDAMGIEDLDELDRLQESQQADARLAALAAIRDKATADRIVTIGDFVERVYLPWTQEHKRPSTAKGYRDIWEDHLKPLCERVWLKDTRTYHVQSWLNQIGKSKLSRNTLQHIKSVISGIFTLAKQQDYFQGENPARDSAINPRAAEPQETYAYSLEEIQTMLGLLPEPAATAFAVAAFMGLRHGEIQGLLWENYRDGELYVARSIWNGRISDPKTRKGRAPVPVIRQLADRLEMHRLRSGDPKAGPIFANGVGNPLALNSVVNRVILPALNRCEACAKAESDHQAGADHPYKRDSGIPEWHGWHAARRGLGSNLYRLGVPDMVIQRILRHANVSTTATYYIKTAAEDVRSAMAKLEKVIPNTPKTPTSEEGSDLRDTFGTPNLDSAVVPSTVN